jgi:hypothetical protein
MLATVTLTNRSKRAINATTRHRKRRARGASVFKVEADELHLASRPSAHLLPRPGQAGRRDRPTGAAGGDDRRVADEARAARAHRSSLSGVRAPARYAVLSLDSSIFSCAQTSEGNTSCAAGLIRTAERSHMALSFQNRRHGIVQDCRQFKVDADSYNEAHPDQEAIQIVFNFENDLAELEAADAA